MAGPHAATSLRVRDDGGALTFTGQEGGMKVLVTSSGQSLHSMVDPRFGRAPFFAVVTVETGELEVIRNEARESVEGAGIKAAELASRLGVAAVITGHCGPKAWRALKAGGINIFTGARGTVAQVIQAYKQGLLQPASAPDVEGHWV